MGAKNLEILAKKSPKTPEIWPNSGRNFRNFSAFCPKFRENFLAALISKEIKKDFGRASSWVNSK